MLFDFRNNQVQSVIDADICIIGAGAAGITIARSLKNSGKRICLLESGSESLQAATQSLYELTEVGIPSSLAAMRLRYFGGTTNHWEGYCGPLDSLDFEPRPWVEDSGWPFTLEELDPYYERAHEVCELGPYAYDTNTLALEHRTYPLYDERKLETQLWQRSTPTRFGSRYRAELESAPGVSVYMNANVIALQTNTDATRVEAVRISTVEAEGMEAKQGVVKAKYFVLACGGIENPRLLLLSNDVQEAGLGNAKDVVGRYWMQHLWFEGATVFATDEERYQSELVTHLFSEYSLADIGARVLPGVALTSQAQQREKILNLIVTIRGGHSTDTGFHQLKRIGGRLKRAEWPKGFGDKLWDVLSDFGSVVDGIGSRIQGKQYIGPFLNPTVYAQMEQAPNRDSRIYLGETTDGLGLRQPVVDWRLSELEKKTLRTTMRLIGEEFARLDLGRVRIEDWITQLDSKFPEPVAGGGHHMGATRMANNPNKGVVDAHCRVHSVDNLYIAGSSVFPTGGCINPTLTIVALALRLADTLAST